MTPDATNGGPGAPVRGAEATKRAANDLMRETLLDVIVEEPFFCECDDAACLAAVWLSREEYDRFRADAAWRPLAPGHGARHAA